MINFSSSGKAVAVSESDNDPPFSSSAEARGQIAELPAPSPIKMDPVWSEECVCVIVCD